MNSKHITSVAASGWWQERKLYSNHLKHGFFTRRLSECEPNKVDAEAAKLKKFSDAGGLKFSDDLTPSQTHASSGWGIYGLLLLISTAALFCKIESFSDLFSGWYLWIEDGFIFMEQAESLGLRALWQPYAGYHHLYLRLIAWCANGFDLALRGPIFFLGWLVAYWILCCFFFESAKNLRFRLFSLILLALLIPLQPTNKTGEVLFNLTNAHWPLAAGWTLWVLTLSHRSPFSLGKCIGLTLLGLTGPFALVASPVLAIKAFLFKDFQRNRWIYLTLFSCALCQGYWILTTSHRINHQPTATSLWEYLEPFKGMVVFGRKWITQLATLAFWGFFFSALYIAIKKVRAHAYPYSVIPAYAGTSLDEPGGLLSKRYACPSTHLGMRAMAFLNPRLRENKGASLSTPESDPIPRVSIVMLLLLTALLSLLAAEWSSPDTTAACDRRFLFIPRTFIFFSALLLIEPYNKSLGLLTLLLSLICAVQFRTVRRPNPAFASFVHYSHYRDILIPISPPVSEYPTPCHVHIKKNPRYADRLLPEYPLDLLDIATPGAQATYQEEKLVMQAADAPLRLFFKEKLRHKETKTVFIEMGLNRSQEGWIQFFWSDDGIFSEKRSCKRWYPSGSIVAQFACPAGKETLSVRLDLLEEREATLHTLTLHEVPKDDV